MPDFPSLAPSEHGAKITSIFDFSPEVLGQLVDYVTQSGIPIPISQIVGFQQFTVQSAPFILTSETRTSSTYGDLATVGPTLTGLSDGKYIVAYGTSAAVNAEGAGIFAEMSIQVNSAAVDDNDNCLTATAQTVSVSSIKAKTLSNGNNTITAKYRSLDNVTLANFSRRWLLALKFANA